MVDQSLLARLPKVDQLMNREELRDMMPQMPRQLVLKAVRRAVDELRQAIIDGEEVNEARLSEQAVALRAAELAREFGRPSLRSLVNATGVVVHTNLGRSLLAEAALQRLIELNRTYTNLEYDLAKGARGSRYDHVAEILQEITGAEAALVVNNNAAAVFLALQTLAQGREVIVSRGQLVEIGGSFRIPEVMARSGAILHEVGSTNKTHLHDYENAVNDQTAMLLKVHTSNFAVVGFHSAVPIPELAELGKKHGLPVMDDLGSGCFMDLSMFGLPKEPTAQEALHQGADLVTFSGDKLLGGPQAGIVLGRADLVERLRKNAMNRALRIDKLTLAALEATLELYRDPAKAIEQIPTLHMISLGYKTLSGRASRLAGQLNAMGLERLRVTTRKGISKVGGGALPLAEPATRLLDISIDGVSPTALEAALRGWSRPIICRLDDGHLLMDVRTLLPGDGPVIAEALTFLAS